MSHQPSLFDLEPPPWEQDDEEQRQVATVVVPDGPPRPLDYLVPESLRGRVQPGMRVRAPLGRGNRSIIGYCVELSPKSGGRKLKELHEPVDTAPLLSPRLLELTRWISEYYLCNWSEAIESAVPAGVRNSAGTREILLLHAPRRVAARLTELKLTAKQRSALTCLIGSPHPLTPGELAELAGCSQAPIQSLRKRGLIEEEVRRVQTGVADDRGSGVLESGPDLTDSQQAALQLILQGIASGESQTTLVNGVTGSGKTEVYIRAIEEVISHGKQAIVLVPEISLTPQTRQRFQSRFARVAVLHSHLTGPERHWHWRNIAGGQVQVVVGARSAVFAPTPRLGLIVLDEEHDASFKQNAAPRYHARDVALWRARQENAALVLGSATPSLESLHRSRIGDYRLVDLPHRVADRPLPDVSIVDLRVQHQERRGPHGALARPLLQAVRQALDDDGQVILLLNRRGFSTHIQCTACGEVVACPDCEISLTHHLQDQKAVCHYCDYEITPPQNCPACGFDGIRYSGLGTQKLEAEVRGRFPQVETLRMDSDTMRKHGSHERALSRFRSGEARILLGTQMIAKGLDFPNVTLVGVINADTALHFPDFRAAERTFQLATQVAGRTGRGSKGGRVLVQTFSPDNPAILAAQRHDYYGFADGELPLREEFGFPPYAAMIRLILRGVSSVQTEEAAAALGRRLLEAAGQDASILGPAPAPLSKLRGKFRFHLLLTSHDRVRLREIVKSVTETLKLPEEIQWAVDVDPIDML